LDAQQPLDDVRVVDLTPCGEGSGIAGGYASKLLADAGAEVWQIEPPEGWRLRSWSASGRSRDAQGDGVLYRYLATSKRAATLDLTQAADRDALLSLYAVADLVLECFSPGHLEGLGLGPDALATRNPRASLLRLSPFGQRSDWRSRPSSEFTLQAWCGSTMARGRPGLPPLYAAGDASDWFCGTYLAVAALAALRHRAQSGQGTVVDLSALEAITPTFTNCGTSWGHFSGVWDLPPSEDVPSIEPTRDAWVGFCLFTAQQWKDFSLLIERPDLGEDPSLMHMVSRMERQAEIREIVRGVTRQKTTAEILELAEALRIPAAPIGNGANLPTNAHFRGRGVFVPNPRGDFLQPRIPYASSGWSRRPFEPASTLTEARASRSELLASSGATSSNPGTAAASPPTRTASPGSKPLNGLRVLDMTAFWAGPYATFVLGGLGADVIKVESIQRPDGMRFGTQTSPETDRWWEYGPTYHAANTGKRAITLDLTRPEGVRLLRELATHCDLLVENYSPRVLEQFGLDWTELQTANPRLSLVRMPAFGLDGPWRDRVGFAQTMEQVSGSAWLTAYPSSEGEAAGPLTPRAGTDPLAGLHAAFAALLAVCWRERTGRGSHIESVMVETTLATTAEQVAEHSASGVLLRGEGNRSPRAAPQGLYACRTETDTGEAPWLAISLTDDGQWPALARCIDREPWSDDPRFATLEARRAAHDEIDAAISAWATTCCVDDAVESLLSAGVPAARVIGTRRGGELTPLARGGFLEQVEHPVVAALPVARLPLHFEGDSRGCFQRPAPTLGEHNEEILRELAGLDDAALEALEGSEIIGTRPKGL
jgi:crotonobetainyl-CoA:carnitine CoA-transferase CaiB-like acyl-CoA transferase